MSSRSYDLARVGYRLGGALFALTCEITVMTVLIQVFHAPEAVALPIMITAFVLAMWLAVVITQRLPLPPRENSTSRRPGVESSESAKAPSPPLR